MHYSKRTLLLFGAGLLLGLVVVSANLGWLGRVASMWMFAGIALLPVALVADWWSHRPWRKPAAKPRTKSGKHGAASRRTQPRKRR